MRMQTRTHVILIPPPAPSVLPPLTLSSFFHKFPIYMFAYVCKFREREFRNFRINLIASDTHVNPNEWMTMDMCIYTAIQYMLDAQAHK